MTDRIGTDLAPLTGTPFEMFATLLLDGHRPAVVWTHPVPATRCGCGQWAAGCEIATAARTAGLLPELTEHTHDTTGRQ